MTRPIDGATGRNKVRDRLQRIEAGLAGSLTPDQDLIDEVYRRRASQLARRQAADSDSATFAVLVVGVGTERYGIELTELAEVFPYRGCTAVPSAPPGLLGVINVRGDIKCVADLGQILELPRGEDSPSGYVVMLRRQGRAIGLRIERIEGVRQIDPVQLLPAGNGATAIPGSQFVKALTADSVILIDTNAALSRFGLGSQKADVRRV
jgi:chemotaxis signal transduction protein